MKYGVAVLAVCLMGPGVVSALGPIEACLQQAEVKYGIPKDLLRAISRVESSGNTTAVHLNYRTYDIGVMQVNSAWLPTLSRYGIRPVDLYDACTNIDVGAWILSQEIAQHGYTWEAVGRYHSPTAAHQTKYIQRIAAALKEKR